MFGSILVACALSACQAPAAVTDDDLPTTFADRTDAWHVERLANLAAPDGWLSLVALAWLAPGPNRVGRAPEAEVAYAGLPADHVGTIVVDEDHVTFEPADGVELEGVPADGVLATDADGDPTILEVGDITFYVVVRGGRLAVRMKDAAAPTRTGFGGIERYPADEAWRITAAFVAAEEGERVDLDTVIGVPTDAPIAGRARFEHQGATVDAVLLKSSGGGSLLRFGDTTNGAGTYTIGRYLSVEPSTDGTTVVLDFNRAFNPPCSFTPYATCSIPPPSNDFPFAVTAGERWSGGAVP